ncbi:MAG TPA: FAD-binding oxidoreductase [Gammaproteobacteria bacterium]|nr:FAD-binding oxidoreductase [Gammaproteobacteria bacterium]
MLDLQVRSICSKWAGLRTFALDRTPVIGFDPVQQGFFWLAGQGGFGIQTAPAMARLAKALATGQALPEDLRAAGVSEQALEPGREFLQPPKG